MFVLGRNEGQWVEVTHTASGDVLRFRVYDIRCGGQDGKQANLAFEDADRRFEIRRGRSKRPAARPIGDRKAIADKAKQLASMPASERDALAWAIDALGGDPT